MDNVSELIKLVNNFDSSLKDFEKDKESIEKREDQYLIKFKMILEPLNDINSFLSLELDSIYKPYIVYFNNLIFTKLKHFFFRENPNTPKNEVLINKKNISLYLSKIYTTSDEKRRKELLVKYFMFLFLQFDFLYSKKSKIGYFTAFKLNEDRFKEVASFLKEKLNKIKNSKLSDIEENFKIFSVDLIARVINIYNDANQNDNLNIYAVFDSYIDNKKKKKKTNIEPFTYYIAYILWKDAHTIQEISDSNNIDELLKDYIENIINMIDSFEKLYNEKDNIADTYVNIFDIHLKTINQINSLIQTFELPFEWEDSKDSFITLEKISQKKKLEKMDFGEYSIESLLQLQDDNVKINSLMYAMFHSKMLNDDKISLFSTYSSGLFLSVVYKLLHPEKEIDIFIFGSFPIINLFPYYERYENSLFSNLESSSNIVILDDMARTGFTFSLMKFTYKSLTNKELNAKHLVFKKSDELLSKSIKEISCSNESNFEFKINPQSIDKLEISDNFDFNSLFLNRTYMLYTIKKMLEFLDDFTEITLYYGSSSGKTLAVLIGYFIKQEKKMKISFNDKNIKDKIFIDLTYCSGFTSQRIKKYNFIEEEFTRICVLKNFDTTKKICSVF